MYMKSLGFGRSFHLVLRARVGKDWIVALRVALLLLALVVKMLRWLPQRWTEKRDGCETHTLLVHQFLLKRL
jgi:hypothetical protein